MAAEAEAKLLKLLGSGADEEVAARAPQQTQRTDSESRTATAPDLASAALRACGDLPPGSVDFRKRNDEFEHSLRSTLQETDFEALKAASKQYMSICRTTSRLLYLYGSFWSCAALRWH